MEQELLEQAEQAMEKARGAGADDMVVQVQDAQKTEYAFRDGKLEQVQQDGSRGVSFRLYVAGRYSTHRTTDLRPDSLDKFVADTVALTRLLEPDPHRVIPDLALSENRPEVALELGDPAVRDLPRDVCLEWLKVMDEASHKDERVVSATSEVSFGWRTSAPGGFQRIFEHSDGHPDWVWECGDIEGRRPRSARSASICGRTASGRFARSG